MEIRKKIAAGAVAAVAVGVGSFFAVNAASAAHSIQASPANPVYWMCHNNSSGTETSVRKYDGSGSYPACGSGYTIYYWSQQGPAGTNGSDAQLTVSAATQLTNRPDSGRAGQTWADDDMTRTITVTRDHEVAAAKCSSSAAACWSYFGTIVDSGSFRSVDGAKSPEAGTDINGIVQGNVAGTMKIEFYASSDTPDASLMPATSDGSAIPTGDWATHLFGDGVTVTPLSEPAWAWTYSAPNTCEQWTDGLAGDQGDIQGVNHCG